MGNDEAAPFHAGELAVQAREGVVGDAARLAAGFRPSFPALAREFLARQSLLVVAGVESTTTRVWASLLTGPPGFVATPDERTLRVHAAAAEGDPLAPLWRDGGAEAGALAIEFQTRRRMKVKGFVEPVQGGFALRARRVFALCPKYIQVREPDAPEATVDAPVTRRGAALSSDQRRLVDAADTFFIASATPEGGPDASHRGGHPGFVRTLAADRIEFADYAGNNMFNTLGNLELRPSAGVLFIDFERGTTLQLTGTARATWDPQHLARFAGARRVVTLDVEQAVEIVGATPQRWRLVERSPFNPPATRTRIGRV